MAVCWPVIHVMKFLRIVVNCVSCESKKKSRFWDFFLFLGGPEQRPYPCDYGPTENPTGQADSVHVRFAFAVLAGDPCRGENDANQDCHAGHIFYDNQNINVLYHFALI